MLIIKIIIRIKKVVKNPQNINLKKFIKNRKPAFKIRTALNYFIN